MIFRLPQPSGVPVYLQLMEQVKHAVETGALREGDQLPTIRKVAGDLVVNPNTVARAYRELEHEGILELRHGSGAFVRESAGRTGTCLAQCPCPCAGRHRTARILGSDRRRASESIGRRTRSGARGALEQRRCGRESMTDFIIETNQLTKSFNGQPALRGLDLRVPQGKYFRLPRPQWRG